MNKKVVLQESRLECISQTKYLIVMVLSCTSEGTETLPRVPCLFLFDMCIESNKICV